MSGYYADRCRQQGEVRSLVLILGFKLIYAAYIGEVRSDSATINRISASKCSTGCRLPTDASTGVHTGLRAGTVLGDLLARAFQ